MSDERREVLQDLADLAQVANGPSSVGHRFRSPMTNVAKELDAMIGESCEGGVTRSFFDSAQSSAYAAAELGTTQETGSLADPAISLSPKILSKEDYAAKRVPNRDSNAVQYSKSQLHEGDTLVVVRFPNNTPVYDAIDGFQLSDRHRVHSTKLKAASPEFKRLLEDQWQQHRAQRRNKLVGKLPKGISYVLDLTPPEEGEEALNLTADLCCSLGLRQWYKTEFTECKVAHGMVGGQDETTAVPMEKIDQQLFDPSNEAAVQEASEQHRVPLKRAGGEDEERILQATIATSKRMYDEIASQKNSSTTITEGKETECLEYCPIRHRTGIERLLQVIEGKDPRLDSAPKVWTLAVLASYFKCPSVVVDYIVTWMIAEPNDKIFEILPEDCLRIGVLTENTTISRRAFTILVSEEALRIGKSKHGRRNAPGVCVDERASNKFTTFGRRCESVDEDMLNSIQHAGRSFHARVEEEYQILFDHKLAWLQNQAEFCKLYLFQEFIEAHADTHDPHLEEKRLVVSELTEHIKFYVLGRMLWCLQQPLDDSQAIRWNNNRWQEQHIVPKGMRSGSEHIYHHLVEQERIMTRYFWDSMRVLRWEQRHFSCDTNLIRDAPIPNSKYPYEEIQTRLRAAADAHNIPKVTICTLRYDIDRLNMLILKYIGEYDFNNGVFPDVEPTTPPSDRSPKSGVSDFLHDNLPNSWEEATTKPEFWRRALAIRDDAIAKASPNKNVHIPDSPAGPSSPIKKRASSSVSTTGIYSYESDNTDLVSPGMLLDSLLLADLGHCVPTDTKIGPKSPFFSLPALFSQIDKHIRDLCSDLLSHPEMDNPSICDTLLCVSDEETKYLPLWAGGLDDGSGGVYEMELPPTERGGPVGPGPGYHTGSTVASSALTLHFDDDAADSMFGGSVATSTNHVSTSVGAEDGYSVDHVDRGRVISEDEFMPTPTSSMSEASYDRLSDVSKARDEMRAQAQTIDLPIRDKGKDISMDEFMSSSASTTSEASYDQLSNASDYQNEMQAQAQTTDLPVRDRGKGKEVASSPDQDTQLSEHARSANVEAKDTAKKSLFAEEKAVVQSHSVQHAILASCRSQPAASLPVAAEPSAPPLVQPAKEEDPDVFDDAAFYADEGDGEEFDFEYDSDESTETGEGEGESEDEGSDEDGEAGARRSTSRLSEAKRRESLSSRQPSQR